MKRSVRGPLAGAGARARRSSPISLALTLPLLALAACEPAPDPSGGAPTAAAPAPSTVKTTAAPAAATDGVITEAPDRRAPAPAAAEVPAPPDVAAPPKDALRTASGLRFKVLAPGKGLRPGPKDKVTVNYTGWTTDGKMFDSTTAHVPPGPTSFRVDGVIKGWTEGLQLMSKGEKRRFWIPADLAYGERPTRPGMPAGMLVFDVELLDFATPPQPPPVPPDVRAPPGNATRTTSGLYYRVLQKGTGRDRPGPTSRVRVRYTGWTTDGKMFDTSYTDDEPAAFSLNRVIKGWTEGLQLMVAGQKSRFWIPAELAYGEKPGGGKPAGMLVFDIELVEFH
ncbi:MAG: FKBP-type peptidyl-prolyl cis-trans isomerase [Polyangiaceae bacterium]|nr:FKBP-type peptidyl-prolyl cis-trans isomerase [Polyangiaceae bacterium]